MRSYRRRLLGAIGAAAIVVGLAPAGVASAAAPTPSFFPVGDNLNTTAYSLRFAGLNRFATSATTAITATDSSGTGYPFGNPDHTGATGTQFGSFGCPASMFFSAGDVPADALAAAGFWETGTYTLPLVSGGSAPINTRDAPMVLTESARNGATDLSGEAIAAIAKIKANCATPDAIIFGGPAAVPPGAVSTIDQLLGNTAVIAGADRFDTAKRLALLHGLGGLPYFATAAAPNTKLNNAVILAEARTGADALSIGPAAAEWSVPVLVTDTASLSPFTQTALAGLSPTNIIVAGGPNAIADAVVSAAKAAAGPGSVATRIFGANRYATSVSIAEQVFGYYPEHVASGTLYSDLTVGLARSEGTGALHVGWPDALTSAEFLAGIGHESGAPDRRAPAIEKNQAEGTGQTEIGDNSNGGWASPLLLTTQGSLSSEVAAYLAALYPDSTQLITATNPGGTTHGGFVFTFGGTSAVGSGTEMAAAQALAGGTYVAANQSDIAPTDDAASTFYTSLNFGAFSTVDGSGGGVSNTNGDSSNALPKFCTLRNALTGVEYMTSYRSSNGALDTFRQAWYEPKLADNAYTPYQSRFQCVRYTNADKAGMFIGVSLSGHETAAKAFDFSAASKTLTGTSPGAAIGSHTGDPTAPVTTNAATSATSQTFNGAINVTYKGVTTPGASYVLTLNYTRTDSPKAGDTLDSLTYTGTLTVVSGSTPIFTATLKGEVLQSDVDGGLHHTLDLAGMYTAGTGLGGFDAVITNATADTAAVTSLNVDGLA